MEIESEDGSKILINNGLKREIGRGLGFSSDDRTISCRHISFELQSSAKKYQKEIDPDSEANVSFEVLGKNPIWVFTTNGDIRVFRKFDKGHMRVGDRFCVSAKKPTLYTLRRSGVEGEEEKDKRILKEVERREKVAEMQKEMGESIPSSDRRFIGDEVLGIESLDISDINPVKEFGFVLLGHEFDQYPKQMVRDIRAWDWFLEELREDCEDNEVLARKGKRNVRIKKKKDEGNDDEDWTGESEDDKELIEKLRRDKRPRYSSTRSKDHNKPLNDTRTIQQPVQKKTLRGNVDNEDEDTLGGFIVHDYDVEQEVFNNDEEEGEEEEEEDYDEDGDDD